MLRWVPFLYASQFTHNIYDEEQHNVRTSSLRKLLTETTWKNIKEVQITIVHAKTFWHVLSIGETVV